MIRNIIFDIGNVLIDFCWKKHMMELGFSDDTIEVLGRNIINNPLWNEFDRNTIPANDIREKFILENSTYKEEIMRFFDNPEGLISVFPQSKNWLRGLKERGYKIYLLSNYPEKEFNIHINKFDFIKYTDGRVVSYEINEIKPNRGIYDALISKFNLRYEESVFLDDKLENIEAADILGMYTIQVKNQKQAIMELELLLQADSQN